MWCTSAVCRAACRTLRQRGKMPAGRTAPRAEMIDIKVVGSGIGAQPADRGARDRLRQQRVLYRRADQQLQRVDILRESGFLLRNIGLDLVDGQAEAKALFVREALGLTGDLPALAKA